MEIEIFEDIELRELQDETERRTHQALARSLSLDMQLACSSSGAPMPYSEADNFTRAVYITIFDRKIELARYAHPLPNRILMLIQIGIDNGWWSTGDLFVRWSSTVPDPILYRKPEGSNEYSDSMILIARWGDALVPFSELAKAATERMRALVQSVTREKIAELNARMEDPEAYAIGLLRDGRTGYYA